MHPRLQRELLNFLKNETDNKYVISTHSNMLIAPDPAYIRVTHLRLVNGATIPTVVESSQSTLDLLQDLGYSASDLLQANCVIWVEGPSDRVYLNRWIELVAQDLKETIDYSIMFYGGRLLSHLSLERDDCADDLVELLKINQNSMILIDSDKASSRKRIGRTKRRIQQECAKNDVLCWITDGREIENYLGPSVIQRAYGQMTGDGRDISFEMFDRLQDSLDAAYSSRLPKKYAYEIAKVPRAREIARHITQEDIGPELRKRLRELINRIEKASSHETIYAS